MNRVEFRAALMTPLSVGFEVVFNEDIVVAGLAVLEKQTCTYMMV
jgi:hypothetical protein